MALELISFKHQGHCPICDIETAFTATNEHYRDYLVCADCPRASSIPRHRAVMVSIIREYPNWRSLRIHESSPGAMGTSLVLKEQCARYVAGQFMLGVKPGEFDQGFRCENLEKQTFTDEAFDLVLSLDVMEHVFNPSAAFQEISRTLVPGGHYIFTAPTYKGLVETQWKARLDQAGNLEYFGPAEYHGNPVDPNGSLVTFHYGYDLPALIHEWSGFDVSVVRSVDKHHGILGEMTEVYICRKPIERLPRHPPLKLPPFIQRVCSPFLSFCWRWAKPAEWSRRVAQAKRTWLVWRGAS